MLPNLTRYFANSFTDELSLLNRTIMFTITDDVMPVNGDVATRKSVVLYCFLTCYVQEIISLRASRMSELESVGVRNFCFSYLKYIHVFQFL